MRHVREADGIETVVLCAHATGALIAALWCHARRASQPADALILASPSLGAGRRWLAPDGGRGGAAPAGRTPPLLAVARRRVRRGLDISCPVLVLCPSADWDAPGGTGGLLALPGRRGALGTWPAARHDPARRPRDLAAARRGPARPGAAPAARRRLVFDELGRWLSAYLSGEIRDQLLLSGAATVTDTVMLG